MFFRNAAELSDESIFEKALGSVGEIRRRKVLRYKNQNAARLSLAAGLAFSDGLRSLGIDPGKPDAECDDDSQNGSNEAPRVYMITYGDHKKLYYNISHSGEIAVCGFSDVPIGVDIELITDRNNESLIKRFSRSEQDYILNDEERVAENLLRVWTLKESYLKCIGIGLSGLDDAPEMIPEKSFKLEHGGETYLFSQDIHEKKYVISVCERSR